MKDKSLEHTGDILPQTVSYMLCGKVIFVELVRDQLVWNPRLVQQAGSVCLFNLFCHNGAKILNNHWR